MICLDVNERHCLSLSLSQTHRPSAKKFNLRQVIPEIRLAVMETKDKMIVIVVRSKDQVS